MARIFMDNGNGIVVGVRLNSAAGFGSLKFPPLDVGGRSRPFVITRVMISQQDVAQWISTLKNRLYVYSFGQEPGKLAVSGVAFHRICGDEDRGMFSGTIRLLDQYDAHCLSARDTPIKISIGERTLEAYLIGCQIDTGTADALLTQFTLSLLYAPPTVRANG